MKGLKTESKSIERARRLIALAADSGSSEEESRSAAVKACKIIAEKKLRLFEQDGEVGESEEGNIVRRESDQGRSEFTSVESWVGKIWPYPPPPPPPPPPPVSSPFPFSSPSAHKVPPSHDRARKLREARQQSANSSRWSPPDPSRHVTTTLLTSYCSECGVKIPGGSKVADKHMSYDRICMPCFETGKGYFENY